MSEQADKAFQEMLDISTDIDKAVLFKGNEVIATNFAESVRQDMVWKALELAGLGDQRAKDMGSSPLTQLMVETDAGSVFLVREAKPDAMGVLATGKKDSRVGLVFYDMKTCMRDAQDEDTTASGEGIVSTQADLGPEEGVTE
jgi:predicted regulator of Ras-like GTPase activity (Roadblock/LC7/MglB family)